jgi:hypothetical protein
MGDLTHQAHDVLVSVQRIDQESIDSADQDTLLKAYALLEDANRVLAQVRTLLRNAAADKMTDKQVVVPGLGTVVKHGKRDRKSWDTESLLRAVLDSRVVDKDTGEVRDETPLDKVLAVWNLGTPRIKELRDTRGIDPDEFCASEWGGWTLEVIK